MPIKKLSEEMNFPAIVHQPFHSFFYLYTHSPTSFLKILRLPLLFV